MWVLVVGYEVVGSRFGVECSRFRVYGSKLKVLDLRFSVKLDTKS